MKSNQIRKWLTATSVAALAFIVVGSSSARAEDRALLRSVSKNGIGKAGISKASTWKVIVDGNYSALVLFNSELFET